MFYFSKGGGSLSQARDGGVMGGAAQVQTAARALPRLHPGTAAVRVPGVGDFLHAFPRLMHAFQSRAPMFSATR